MVHSPRGVVMCFTDYKSLCSGTLDWKVPRALVASRLMDRHWQG